MEPLLKSRVVNDALGHGRGQNEATRGPRTHGFIFNVQHYSIHDGPGIRTTVFLKGCPLRCSWCQNPESQALRPEVFFDNEKCAGCGNCIEQCPVTAIAMRNAKSETNRALCKRASTCGWVCVDACPNEARSVMGRCVTASEVFREVADDRVFYERSGGGVTVSGGEPLYQPRFVMNLLELCKDAGLHTTLDTCGHAKWSAVRQLLSHVDLVLYDLKHMDPAVHRKYTGVSNATILDNARRILHELSLPLIARIPVVPGFNDSIENIEATARFIAEELDRSVKVCLLPYHRLGETKYERLDRRNESASIEPPAQEHVSELQQLIQSFGLEVQIGG